MGGGYLFVSDILYSFSYQLINRQPEQPERNVNEAATISLCLFSRRNIIAQSFKIAYLIAKCINF